MHGFHRVGSRSLILRTLPVLLAALTLSAALASTAAAAPPQRHAQDSHAGTTDAVQPQLAARPYMGWTSWDSFRCNVSAETVEQQALLLHQKLQRFGYDYVNIDSDCENYINSDGYKIYNPSLFPQGLEPVSQYVHKLGLKLGVYLYPGIPIPAVQQNTPIPGTPYHAQDIIDGTSAYGNTFENTYPIDYSKPGAQQYIDDWADWLASQGVDYVKLDAVSPGSDTTSYNTMADVRAWREALDQTGRKIWLEISWHIDPSEASFWKTNANGWRADDDIDCYATGSCTGLTAWSNPTGYVPDTIVARFFDAPAWSSYTGPGGWADLDALDIGNAAKDGLTDTQSQTAMTLWAITRSPLYTGDDLSTLTSHGLSLLTNRGAIAVDQAGLPGGKPVASDTDQQVWYAPMPGGARAVALFNLGGQPEPVSASWKDLGFCGSAGVKDIWANTSLGQHQNGFEATVPAQGSRLLIVKPDGPGTCPATPPSPPSTYYPADSPQNTLSGNASLTSCSSCSGGEMAGNLYQGGAIQFNGIQASHAGQYLVTFSYASDNDGRTAYIGVNGTPDEVIGDFPLTGGWDTMETYTIRVDLQQGDNTITISSEPQAGSNSFGSYDPNFAGLSVSPASSPTAFQS
jgi:alpha galactosidase A-like protein/alpha galactosidase C-like protein/carbohydrate binding protein with CBM6 domain